ncbi:hypothetical protein AMS58_18210 [Pseudoalteromonas porphyrae]|uniref:Uncharacterized protein n=1 Tax=Pseudoalteromonas porphyrae TaxID=187330 RepID=A0A0N1ESQ5_9GAMM|nr:MULTISPECIES: hypothetical protein [Pseudoalteromonas]KPH60165.1 hypothetical protein ADS77_16020 [Pseudoalteromonas porphyrae]KPH93228.1 hypothetical protein AMS58_18210 [Pseudoalteromonas porphyrae]NNG42468.1 hypothetical protein [Pseudoalteromonas sp. NEC-BIFX-2020_002]
MKTILRILLLSGAALTTNSVFATDLVCDVYPKGSNGYSSNGTARCDAFDFSFGNSTTGKFYLQNISKPINQVIWQGDASCSGGTSCTVNVRAYRSTSASALILYKDGTYETTNIARMSYETGH